jgi:hypothetical protein
MKPLMSGHPRQAEPPRESSEPGSVDLPADRPQWLNTAIIALLTLLAVSIPFWANMEGPGLPMDEGYNLVYPELMLHGKVPYRDFETFYGPGNLLALAGAYSVFGVNVFVERGVGLAYRLLLLLGVFLGVRRAGSSIAVGGTLCAALVLWLTKSMAFAWLGGVACALFSVVLLAEGGRRRTLLAGVLAAAALLYRQDLGPAVIFSALPLLWRAEKELRWRYLAGFALGLTPLAVLTVIAGPVNVFNNLFLYPVILSGPGRRLPLDIASDWEFALVFIHVAACLCGLLAGAVTWKMQPKSLHGPCLLSMSLLALGLTHQVLQRADSVHIAGGAFLSVALLPWTFHLLASRGQGDSARPWRGFACGMAAVLLLFVTVRPVVAGYGIKFKAALGSAEVTSIFVRQDARQFPVNNANRARCISAVLSTLKAEAKPGQRLFVGPHDLRRSCLADTFIYHLAPWLVPASYFMEMNPLSANRPNSRLAADVATADWLVLNLAWDSWNEPNTSRVYGSDAPNEIVRTQFESFRKVGEFEIFRRKAPVALAAAPAEPVP